MSNRVPNGKPYDDANPIHQALYSEAVGNDPGGSVRAMCHNSEICVEELSDIIGYAERYLAQLHAHRRALAEQDHVLCEELFAFNEYGDQTRCAKFKYHLYFHAHPDDV